MRAGKDVTSESGLMGTTVLKSVRNVRKLDDLWLVPGGSNHGGHKHVLQLEHG